MFDKTTNRHRGKRDRQLGRRVSWQLLHGEHSHKPSANTMARGAASAAPVGLRRSLRAWVSRRTGSSARDAACRGVSWFEVAFLVSVMADPWEDHSQAW